MSVTPVAEPLPRTLRDRFPIYCKVCGEKIIGGDYRVTGLKLQDNGIPYSLYSHKDCMTSEDTPCAHVPPMFVGVAHCVYCGEETNSDDFECDECKRRVSREMRPAGELSAAAREFIERLAQLCQSQLAGKTQEPHQGNGNGHKPAAVDERDLQVKQSAELPDVSPDDFRPFVPTNEQGVVYMTGSIAKDIGYRLTHVQSAYPDAIFVSPSQKVLKVEFEYASSNFIQHGHDPALCDMVICWNRDRDLPVPVLELSRYYDPQTGRWDFRGV